MTIIVHGQVVLSHAHDHVVHACSLLCPQVVHES